MNPVIQAHSERVVPFEPTEAMEKAFNAICPVGEDFGDAWSAACAAAPTKTKPTQQDAVDAEHAENYRWLRDNADIDEGPAVVDQRCNDWGNWYSIQVKGDELDSAIRAAISGKKGGAA